MRRLASGKLLDRSRREGGASAPHFPSFQPTEEDTNAQPIGDSDDAPLGRLRFRTIWISDTHLGTPGCQAHALLDFLRRTESDFSTSSVTSSTDGN
jgi:hypothetical protein